MSTGPAAPRYVHDLLDRAAGTTPEACAVASTSQHLSFARLCELSHGFAQWLLDQGTAPGDRVLVQAWNCPAITALAFGVSRIGAVLVPLGPELRPYQLRQLYEDAEPTVVLADAACAGSLALAGIDGVHEIDSVWDVVASGRSRPVVRSVGLTDLALLVYTSGSTSVPKGVMCQHDSVLFATFAIAERLRYRPSDRVFLRLPMSFDYGLYQLFLTIWSGAALYLADQRETAGTLRELTAAEATVVPLVPSLAVVLNQLATRQPAPCSVRLFTNTGAPLPPAAVAGLRKNFPSAAVVLMYGITECKRVSIAEPDADLNGIRSLGPPLRGTEVFVIDGAGGRVGPHVTGQIVVRGPHVMAGYWRAEALTRQRFREVDGARLLYTGDYGWVDDAGHVHFEGRRDDILKRRGVRVSTLEVEAAALDVPGVRAAAAIARGGRRDELVLFVAGDLEAAEVARGVADRLEPAKRPDRVVVLAALPVGGHGKTDRAALLGLPGTAGRTERPPADPVDQLLARYGSPLFRYDLAEIQNSAAALRQALPEYATVYYSVKANPHPDVVAALRQAGCRAEVSSFGEAATVLAAGHDMATVLYTGPGKSAAEVRRSIDLGVRLFSVESIADLQRVLDQACDAGVEVECLIRVNSAVAGGSSGIRMTGKPSQFGLGVEDAPDWAARALDIAGPALRGLHFFPMSNAQSAESILAELVGSLETAAHLHERYGLPVGWLDLGGGFAAPYAAAGARPDYSELPNRIDAAIRKFFPAAGADAPRIAFESGRYLVSTAGSLLATVVDVKHNKGRAFIVLDAGINHLGGMSGLQRLMPLAARPIGTGAATGRATLVGPLCTPNDVLAREIDLPPLAVGNRVVIPNVGAYGLSASLVAFLSRDLPAEVVMDGDRVVSVSRQELQRIRLDP
jgi:diaminopimelate decarboxylase/acyl-CoA synthetase (AMP-forming)/AMP-acid ligase II